MKWADFLHVDTNLLKSKLIKIFWVGMSKIGAASLVRGL